MELDIVKYLDRLRIAAEEQLQSFPRELLKDSVSEQQWEEEVQREIGSVMAQSLIERLQDEFETSVCEERNLLNTINKKWQRAVSELATMRQELDALYSSSFSSEPGALLSHASYESLEECSSCKRREHFPSKAAGNLSRPTFSSKENDNDIIVVENTGDSGKQMPSDSPQLMCMTNKDLVAYFRAEMTKMKRQHDSALQEKTEELFTVKREHLKEKGSGPLRCRKEKDFEPLRKKILECMSKLDTILSDNEKLPFVLDDQERLCRLKEKIDTLFKEDQGIRNLLEDRKREAKCLVSQAPPVETNFPNKIQRLHSDMEDLDMEGIIKDEIYMGVLKGLVGELESDFENSEMVSKIVEDNFSIIYRGVFDDALSNVKLEFVKMSDEKDSINAVLSEKEKTLCITFEENEKLKQEIASLVALIKEKEQLLSEVESELVQQQEQFGAACRELHMSRDQIRNQEILISSVRKDSDLMKGKLEETFQQLHRYEVEISNLNQKFKFVSETLEEAERQKSILHSSIQETQAKLASAITKEEEQKKHLKSIIVSMKELSESIENCNRRLTDNLETKEVRLKTLNDQCSQLIQQAELLKKNGLWYKQKFERRCSDLQKAETEVDLLGDEVDVLSGLLEKIYIALEHYSPVLQHYPGVVETLKLIKRELKGGSIKSVKGETKGESIELV